MLKGQNAVNFTVFGRARIRGNRHSGVAARWGRLMPVRVNVTEVYNREIARRLETAVSQCFSGRPDHEQWTVTITSWDSRSYRVVVQSPSLKRERVFLQGGEHIVEDISTWVGLYLPPLCPPASGETAPGG